LWRRDNEADAQILEGASKGQQAEVQTANVVLPVGREGEQREVFMVRMLKPPALKATPNLSSTVCSVEEERRGLSGSLA
jgi:hypothetical protein